MSINFDLIIQLVTFLVLLYILNTYLFRPIMGIIAEREHRFETFAKQANHAVARTEELQGKIDFEIQNIRTTARQQRDLLIQETLGREKEAIEKAKNEAQKLISSNKQELVRDRQESKKFLEKEAQTIARALAEKLLGRS
jgi:F-type H+-transporting ATPase subunit b